MPVSKRLRYEILRRDNHACRYCGAKAPDVALVVDHVLPEALGGETDAENLVAACQPCNAGKAATAPDQEIVADVDQDAIRWARAMKVAADQALLEAQQRDEYIDAFVQAWSHFDGGLRDLPDDFDSMVAYWRRVGMPSDLVVEAVFIAMGKRSVPMHAKFRYVIGIVRNQLASIETKARELLAAEGES